MLSITNISTHTHRLLRFVLCLTLFFGYGLGSFQQVSAKAAPAMPDLKVLSVTWGANCAAKFTIQNAGSGNAIGNFSFIASPLYIPAWGTGPQTGWSATIFGLPAGQSVTHKWETVKSWHSEFIKVTVDPQNQIIESNESNNSVAILVPSQCRY